MTPSSDEADPTVAQLQEQLAAATVSAREAFRDTTRLIRLLSVLGEPASPETLVDQTLTVLSEVFYADVACVAHVIADRLVVTGCCGLPEDDQAFTRGLPLGSGAAQALAGHVVARNGGLLDPADAPGSIGRLGIRSAVWVPLSPQSYTSNLLILYRSSDEPFTPSDIQVLTSVAVRLRLAVDERERSAVVERLARYGHRLARHLAPEPLLDEAVELLRKLTAADQAWIVTLDETQARLRAQRGLSSEVISSWPRPLGEHDEPAGPGVLRVPVLRDETISALLFVSRQPPRPFARDTWEIMTIFANYLGVALTNAELYRTLEERATRDSLTSLANRSVIAAHLEQALLQRSTSHVGLLFCDLDGFKSVNDRLGHEAGDELLQQVAVRLRRRVRPTDLLARFGGDEFVVVIDGVTQLAEVAEVGRRIADDLNDVFVVSGEQVHVTASIGGVLGTQGTSTPSAMLRDADAAMYVAKGRGPGQVEVFDDAASHRSLDRLDLRSELRHALDRDQLALHYQPIFSLNTGRILAFEALLRWTHPHHGSVSPDVFIPLAEDTGAIVEIGRWVLDQACRQLAIWHRLPHWRTLAMAVNISPAQLRGTKVAEETLGVIRRTGLEPSDIWLEITEHSYLRHDVTEYATTLRAAGVRFALDDFGTAYSNLAYLKRLPIEILKIDRSFVSGVTGPELDLSIVRAIIAIADSLGLSCIAEGIETEEQRVAVQELGCRLGQGFLLSPPLPPEEATELLRTEYPLDAVRVPIR
ncbi:diguanylate cyclase (GGDEF)-like protein [Allocatelliglobosispora scoriae]|uniref:Diguanylate cyclase (GGDEF)-like protein n=1 Tax=Allocatelliglobosispora scoriae TaxID=643052 RepID=A0A841BLM1_9ACTN|nr:EAL domain-containing protein [Allocatelliglobosispora scoriae]MBB5867873.1 diguanylate cyclase (GGDEF)-like protein [Allocatelliglobosispora scoriae]